MDLKQVFLLTLICLAITRSTSIQPAHCWIFDISKDFSDKCGNSAPATIDWSDYHCQGNQQCYSDSIIKIQTGQKADKDLTIDVIVQFQDEMSKIQQIISINDVLTLRVKQFQLVLERKQNRVNDVDLYQLDIGQQRKMITIGLNKNQLTLLGESDDDINSKGLNIVVSPIVNISKISLYRQRLSSLGLKQIYENQSCFYKMGSSKCYRALYYFDKIFQHPDHNYYQDLSLHSENLYFTTSTSSLKMVSINLQDYSRDNQFPQIRFRESIDRTFFIHFVGNYEQNSVNLFKINELLISLNDSYDDKVVNDSNNSNLIKFQHSGGKTRGINCIIKIQQKIGHETKISLITKRNQEQPETHYYQNKIFPVTQLQIGFHLNGLVRGQSLNIKYIGVFDQQPSQYEITNLLSNLQIGDQYQNMLIDGIDGRLYGKYFLSEKHLNLLECQQFGDLIGSKMIWFNQFKYCEISPQDKQKKQVQQQFSNNMNLSQSVRNTQKYQRQLHYDSWSYWNSMYWNLYYRLIQVQKQHLYQKIFFLFNLLTFVTLIPMFIQLYWRNIDHKQLKQWKDQNQTLQTRVSNSQFVLFYAKTPHHNNKCDKFMICLLACNDLTFTGLNAQTFQLRYVTAAINTLRAVLFITLNLILYKHHQQYVTIYNCILSLILIPLPFIYKIFFKRQEQNKKLISNGMKTYIDYQNLRGQYTSLKFRPVSIKYLFNIISLMLIMATILLTIKLIPTPQSSFIIDLVLIQYSSYLVWSLIWASVCFYLVHSDEMQFKKVPDWRVEMIFQDMKLIKNNHLAGAAGDEDEQEGNQNMLQL